MKEPERPGDEPIDITPKEFAVRSTCQEYGGGAFSCSGDIVIFSNYKDQRLYKQSISSRGIKVHFVVYFASAIFLLRHSCRKYQNL